MKSKKILTMISSVAMAATLGVTALAGCNNGGGHQHAYNWTVDYEATCVAPGQRTGKCVCGDARNEVIPIDPDAHDYNDWEITEYPTESKNGKATRTCKLQSSHVFEADLPKITEAGTGYASSEITVKPTIISAGKRHFVFNHEAGAVEFDIELPRRTTVENVEDAVVLGSSLHETVRESNGRYVDGDPYDPKYDENSDKYDPNEVLHANSFTNYYGDNYVHVHDSGNSRDFWYSRDESGNPFGISALVDKENVPYDPRVDESVTEQNLLGFGYASGGGMRTTYGAEDTLLCYYNASQSDGAIKYNDSFVKNSAGEYICSFEFSRKEQPHFCRYTVEFTLYASGAIKTLSVRTKIIRSFMLANSYDGTNAGEVILDSDGDVIFSEIYPLDETTGEDLYETNYVYERDNDGNVIYDPVYVYERDDTKPNNPIKYDENGDPVILKDENGDPVTEKDENGNTKTEPRKTYTYEYEKDEDGKTVVDENGNPVIAKDTNGAKIKYPVIGDPPVLISGVKQKPDGTTLLDRFGREIARLVPQGWKEGDARQYYYEKGDKKYDGTDDVYDEDHPFIVIRVIEFSQTLKVEGEEIETNPYPAESVYIRSFDVSYNGKTLENGEKVEIPANENVIFNISNVQPADTAKLDFDPLRVYLKTASGNEIELNYTGSADFNQNAYHIVGYFSRENKTVLFNAQYAGEITLVLRTLSGKCEREIVLDIKKGKPSSLIPYVYTYSDANGTETHIWTEYTEPVTLYVGQPLYVRATATAEEANYVDDSFVTSVSNTYSTYFKLEDNIEGVDNNGNKITVSKITPLQVTTNSNGVRVYIDSIFMNDNGTNPVASTDIRLKVVEAPSVDGMFTGEYSGRFNLIKIAESDRTLRPADVKVTVTPDASDGAKGTFTVVVSDGTNNFTSVYSYSYNADTHELASEYVSGREDDTFKFEFTLNEVYKLAITHPTYPGRSETIVLSRPRQA